PLGSCFSGGLDSSLIVSLARKELGGGLTGVSFDNGLGTGSDAPFARECGEKLDVNVEVIKPSAHDMASDLDDLVYHQDAPFESASIFAQYAVFRRAKECGITVMLDGQGADEFFGGYRTSISARICEALLRGDVLATLRLANTQSYPDRGSHRRMLIAGLGRIAPVALTAPLLDLIGEPLVLREMNREWFVDRGATPRRRPEGRGLNALREELAIQVGSWSLPHLLRYEDRNSMAFSIEARVPFCTPEVAEMAAQLPADQLISSRGETKAVLRAAARNQVPASVLDRPKLGFNTDQVAWLREAGPTLQKVLNDDVLGPIAALDKAAARTTVTAALKSGGGLSQTAWRLLVLAIWSARFGVSYN
ncbi:MAG TPA: asparagine synthase C-terminal domain-containing protein, partial [Gemmatimonadaceae bacterium]|nr:asparagine synthase C-terminal domain-containing protein [Gemmatimonadaceae bacterium]